jgi:hypothetical protein
MPTRQQQSDLAICEVHMLKATSREIFVYPSRRRLPGERNSDSSGVDEVVILPTLPHEFRRGRKHATIEITELDSKAETSWNIHQLCVNEVRAGGQLPTKFESVSASTAGLPAFTKIDAVDGGPVKSATNGSNPSEVMTWTAALVPPSKLKVTMRRLEVAESMKVFRPSGVSLSGKWC